MTSRKEFVSKLESRLEQWDREIDRLQIRADRLDAAAQTHWQQSLDQLRARSNQARDRLAELRAAGDNAWQELRAGAEQAWQELGEAVSAAGDQLG